MFSIEDNTVGRGGRLPNSSKNTLLELSSSQIQHLSPALEQLFFNEFYADYRTRLQGGAEEPLYLASEQSNTDHIIFYREDFFASALHEVAHWCIAGEQRRLKNDFGYWYNEDGRGHREQLAFERVEVKPQAIEMLFSEACQFPFQLSQDNLTNMNSDGKAFRDQVFSQVETYNEQGLPLRAHQYYCALKNAFDKHDI